MMRRGGRQTGYVLFALPLSLKVRTHVCAPIRGNRHSGCPPFVPFALNPNNVRTGAELRQLKWSLSDVLAVNEYSRTCGI